MYTKELCDLWNAGYKVQKNNQWQQEYMFYIHILFPPHCPGEWFFYSVDFFPTSYMRRVQTMFMYYTLHEWRQWAWNNRCIRTDALKCNLRSMQRQIIFYITLKGYCCCIYRMKSCYIHFQYYIYVRLKCAIILRHIISGALSK